MARNTDFIGFTFNGCHSSEFNIYSVSDGSRYQDNLVPNPIDYTEQVPGGVGQYYFGSDMDIKEFPLSIAYDNLSELQVRELRNWLAPDTVGELSCDERPYKTYTAKISTSPSLSFICFDKYNSNTGKKERVYKGEGSINFVCYYPLGVVSGDKKQLGWYREQIDDRIYRSIGGSSSIIDYKLENNEIAIFEKIKGNTIEIGSGDKSPDNPYNIVGSNPTKVTVCGKNLLTYPYTSKTKTEVGVTFTDLGNGAINCSGTCTIAQGVLFSFRGAAEPFTCFPGFTYSVSGCPAGGGDSSVGTYCIRVVEIKNGTIIWNNRYTDTGHGITFQVAEEKQFVINFTVWGFATVNNLLVRPQIEISPAATPYAPYTGQTVPLPALEPLYGDGTVCDEYDAATGVENRRWGRVELDGTEAWITRTSGTGVYGYALPDVFDAPAAAGVCTHFSFVKNGASGTQTAVCVASAGTQKALSVFTTIATLDDFKAWLAAQATAGTPVTVVYQLDEPVITKIEEILPFSNFLPSADSGLIINANPEYYNYFTDSNANISLRLYGAKYSNIDEWALSTGMIEDLDTTGVNKGYDHYITLPDGSKGIQLFNPGDKDTDFILSFNKPTPMNDIVFTLSNGEQFMLNLRSSDTDVEDYGAVSDAEKRIAVMTGGVITIDTKKNRIMYKYGTGENVNEESIYFALKKGQFFKIPKNRTSTGGYNLVIGTTSNIETDSIKISYDYLYY